MNEQDSGLTPEQKELVDGAAMVALIDLLADPSVAKLPSGVIAQVFLAGVKAGVSAFQSLALDELRQALAEDSLAERGL